MFGARWIYMGKFLKYRHSSSSQNRQMKFLRATVQVHLCLKTLFTITKAWPMRRKNKTNKTLGNKTK